MFYCQKCNKLSAPNEASENLIVKTKPVKYTNVVRERIKESYGWEIVKELQVCSGCYKENTGNGTF